VKILGIDTSTKYLSVAVTKNGKLLGEYSQDCAQAHSLHLVPVIKKLLNKIKLQLKDMDALCISIGPGSFTGLRIGASTVKGLAVAAKKPIVPVPTLDVIAKNAMHHSGKVCVILDARKQQVYACLYDIRQGKSKRASKYMLLKIDDLLKKLKGEILLLGDAIAVYRQEIEKDKKIKPLFADEALWYPDPYWVCVMGQEMLKKGKKVSAQDLVPMYIYAKTCTITKPVTRNQ